MTLMFGLRNAAETVGLLVAQRTPPSPTNDEFMGMTEYIMESFYDLLVEESELPSSSDSSRGSYHPSHECFMAGTPEGHVESIHEEEATPMNSGPASHLGGAAEGPTQRAQGSATPA